MYVRFAAAVGTAAIALSTVGAAGAQAENPFHCEASALRATLAAQQSIEPAVAGRTTACDDHVALPTADVPGLLSAQALVARSAFDPATGTGSATGGLAHLAIAPAAAAPLPPTPVALPQPLADALAPLGIPSTLSLDLTRAVAAQLPAPPAGGLITADVLRSDASVTCAGGAPKLDGSSTITGLELAGQDVPLDGPVTRAITLAGGQTIAPGDLDPALVDILTPLAGATPAQLQQVRDALGPALAQLPPLDIPAAIADVTLRPKEQLSDASSLTQRALHATISVGGRQVLDAVVGEAKVSAATAAGACAQVAAQGVSDQALACTDRKLVLVDVLRQGARVKLLGAANRDYVGRRVAIRLRSTGRIVAHATVHDDGSFRTTAPMPPRAQMASHTKANALRYRAEIGKERSLPLKLQRRMIVTELSSRKGKVTIAGRVTRPLTTPVATIRLVRRVSCHKVVLVRRFKPRADGTFRVTVKAPKGQAAAVYRLTTRVREKPSNPRTYPTFTLPRGVALNTR
jgi:hypothetical protein